MTKQATPHPRLAIVSRLRCRLKLSAPAASRRMEPNFTGYLSYRRASTGVSAAARQAGSSAESTAITVRVTKASIVLSQLTGSPGNMSGIFTSLSALESPNATDQPITPLTNASTTPSAMKSENAPARRAQRFTQADFPRPLRHRHQHDVHHADAAERQRHECDEPQKHRHRIDHAVDLLLIVHGVPHPHRAIV